MPLVYALTLAAGALALAATIVATIGLRSTALQISGDLGESGGRAGFMAIGGVMLSGLSLMVITVESFGLPFLSSCG